MKFGGNRATQGRQVVSLLGIVPHQLLQFGQLSMNAVDGLRVWSEITLVPGDHKTALSSLGILRQRKQVGQGQKDLLSVLGKFDVAPQSPHVRVRDGSDRQKGQQHGGQPCHNGDSNLRLEG